MQPRWLGYISIVVIAAAIATAGMLAQAYLEETSRQLVGKLEAVQMAINQKEWQESQRRLLSFKKRWNTVRQNWELFIDHGEIDNLQMRVSRVSELLEAHDTANASAELAEAIMLMEHVPERERLTWRNLF